MANVKRDSCASSLVRLVAIPALVGVLAWLVLRVEGLRTRESLRP